MPPARQPWPMKWIVLAIVLFLVPYTYLNLHYRKPGPAYQPYQDSRQRAALEKVGYQRVTCRVDRPSDPKPSADTALILPAPGGLPADLLTTFPAPPLMPAEIGLVGAAASLDAGETYQIQFSCTQSDNLREVIGAHLYFKAGEIFALPDSEALPAGLIARTRAAVIRIRVPPASLPAGAYHLTLVGEQSSKSWTLQVH
jgi:hypothetical protein